MKQTQKNKKPASSLVLIRQLLGYFRPYKALFWTVIAVVLSANAFELVRPKVLGWLIDQFKAGAPGRETVFNIIAKGGGLYLAASFGSALFTLLYGLFRARLSQNVVMDMRCDIFSKIQSLSFRYHDTHHSGGLITKATRDIDHLRIFFGEVAFEICQFAIIIAGSFAIILSISVKLALICYVFLPLTAFLVVRAGRRLRVLFKDADDEYDKVTETLRENITGIRVVKAFGQEPGEIRKFDSKVTGFKRKIIRGVDHFAFHLPLANNIFGLSLPAVLGFGGYLAVKGAVSYGDLAACMFYLSIINRKMRMLGKIVDRTQNAVASADRINQILNEPSVITDAGPRTLKNAKGRLAFDNVSFGFEKDKPVLHHIDLEIEPGETVAFVGPTGAGKTAMAMLAPRFYEVDAGRVLFDGTDIREIPLRDLRTRVSMVFQEPFLFSATIAENIAFGRPEADMKSIVRAAKTARIHDFVSAQKWGYDTVIGERGINLSGGQKQRLTIARAVLTDPALLILDDCTSSLDAVTEKDIQGTIEEVARQRTTIVIAQRISTIRNADRVVVFSQGRIADMGTHRELADRNGLYRDIFFSQTFERTAESVKS